LAKSDFAFFLLHCPAKEQTVKDGSLKRLYAQKRGESKCLQEVLPG
jgi:hypothetical protein